MSLWLSPCCRGCMATERLRRLLTAAALAGFVLLALAIPLPVAAATPSPRPVPASEPWWLRVAFAGQRVQHVRANGDLISVALGDGTQQQSRDGGRSWTRVFEPLQPEDNGLRAAPASLPGVVVTVDRDGVVQRRDADGHRARALLLLPQGWVQGPPRITALVAFETQPLTDTVYLGTDGYSVLASSDGGDDWYRAGPGLPDRVLALATDATTQAVYAGTDDGLWVHHLRAFPAPPAYADAALRWRWLGIALVTVAASAAAAGVLLRLQH